MSDIEFVFNGENKTDTLAPCSKCGEMTDDVEYLRGIGDRKLYCRPCSLSGPSFARLLELAKQWPDKQENRLVQIFDDRRLDR